MGLQVRIFIGSQSPSVFVLDSPVISIGCEAYCDVNLELPGIPNIACLIERGSRNEIFVQTDHSNLIMLGSEFLDKSQKKRWQANQELFIGSMCRIVLENADSKESASKFSTSEKTGASPPPHSQPQEKTSQTRAGRTDEKTTNSHRTSSSNARSSSFSSPPKSDKTSSAAPEPPPGASFPQEADPQKSSPILMALVVITALAICVAMLMVDSTSGEEKGDEMAIGALMEQMNKTLDSMGGRDGEKKNIENIRQQLQNAYSLKNNPNEAKRIYILIKRDISNDINNKDFSSSEPEVLKKKILQYVNYQLTPKQKTSQ